MIKNLIFDFGKVLIDYDFIAVLKTFFDSQEKLSEFEKLVCGQDFIDKCDKELVPFAELIRQTQKEYPQWERELQLFYDHYQEYVIGEVPGMKDLLCKLKEQGFKLYGLTNWCSEVHKVIARYDILHLLDGRVISSEEHLIKPEIAIYQRLCQKYNLRPEECLFTDDKAINVQGALNAGMHAILFENTAQFEADLNKALKETC